MSAQKDADWELPEALAVHVDPAYRNFVGPGWRSILARLHDRLVEIEPNYRLDQVKEKMGVLRIYPADDVASPAIREQIEAAIAQAVSESAVTCERCGQPGRLRNDSDWRRQRHYVLTLCDRCATIELAEYRARSGVS